MIGKLFEHVLKGANRQVMFGKLLIGQAKAVV